MTQNFGQFIKAFNADVEKKVNAASAHALRVTTQEVYNEIFLKWPAYTFYSMANHNIDVGENVSTTTVPTPPERPKEKGALMGEQEANRTVQLTKLNAIKPFDKVFISNPVPYAADVGGSEEHPKIGNGIAIYAEAAAVGSARAASIIKQGIR